MPPRHPLTWSCNGHSKLNVYKISSCVLPKNLFSCDLITCQYHFTIFLVQNKPKNTQNPKNFFFISHIQSICKSCGLYLQNTQDVRNLSLLLHCYLPSLSYSISHSPHFVHYLCHCDSQSFWSQDPFTLLKITGDPKELFLIWVISVDVDCIKNWNWEIVKILIV